MVKYKNRHDYQAFGLRSVAANIYVGAIGEEHLFSRLWNFQSLQHLQQLIENYTLSTHYSQSDQRVLSASRYTQITFPSPPPSPTGTIPQTLYPHLTLHTTPGGKELLYNTALQLSSNPSTHKIHLYTPWMLGYGFHISYSHCKTRLQKHPIDFLVIHSLHKPDHIVQWNFQSML